MTVMLAAACRTPFTGTDGALACWHPVDLSALVMNEVVHRGGVAAESVDEVWVGCAEPVGAQGANMARAAVLSAGWPDRISGTVVDSAEMSGSAALHAAAAAIKSGSIDTAVVIGVSLSSLVAPGASALGRVYGQPWGGGPTARVEADGGLLPPPRAAESTAGSLGIDRAQQDLAAARSVERRRAAADLRLATVAARPGSRLTAARGSPIANDEHRGAVDDPAELPPLFVADGTVTAFSFAPPADGAAALLLTGGGRAAEAALADLLGVGRAAGNPLDATGGADLALQRALSDAGVDQSSIARWEIVESTAAGFLSICDRLEVDPAIANRDGGALGVGDAGAAEELRLSVDGVLHAAPGECVAAVSAGSTGSAVTLWRRRN
ncbi:MAG: hypothetical protein OXN44_09265 [Acidimicrobiaceae bacterium]|nr:hypothetical protein [Acidimicrobiaceae bacterium]